MNIYIMYLNRTTYHNTYLIFKNIITQHFKKKKVNFSEQIIQKQKNGRYNLLIIYIATVNNKKQNNFMKIFSIYLN